MSSPGTISVVIIGHNEGIRLERALTSIGRALEGLPKSTEVIYVDSASTDDSIEIATRRSWLRIVRLPAQLASAASARNAGLFAARGELVQLLA